MQEGRRINDRGREVCMAQSPANIRDFKRVWYAVKSLNDAGSQETSKIVIYRLWVGRKHQVRPRQWLSTLTAQPRQWFQH